MSQHIAAATGVSPARSVTISHWRVRRGHEWRGGRSRRRRRPAINAVPRLAFQPLLQVAGDVSTAGCERLPACARTSKLMAPCSAQPVALAAQFFQLLRTQRLVQHLLGIARRVEQARTWIAAPADACGLL